MASSDHLQGRQFRTADQIGQHAGEREVVGWFEGDDDYPIAGYVRYQPGNPVKVSALHVEPERRRMGVASRVMDHLEALYGADNVDHGDRTPDGQAFIDGRNRKREDG